MQGPVLVRRARRCAGGDRVGARARRLRARSDLADVGRHARHRARAAAACRTDHAAVHVRRDRRHAHSRRTDVLRHRRSRGRRARSNRARARSRRSSRSSATSRRATTTPSSITSKQALSELTMPWVPVPGNHDWWDGGLTWFRAHGARQLQLRSRRRALRRVEHGALRRRSSPVSRRRARARRTGHADCRAHARAAERSGHAGAARAPRRVLCSPVTRIRTA